LRYEGYRTRFLGALGILPTRERLRFLEGWARAEGGTARFNAFNTTYAVVGSTRYNDVGVRNYEDAEMGIAATVLTIRLPYYDHLVAALRAPGLSAEEICRQGGQDLNTWGTGASNVRRNLRPK